MTTLSHDGFARQSTVRETMHNFSECDWCGQQRRSHGEIRSLFRYGTQTDQLSGRVNWHRGGFCSKSCHDSYHSKEPAMTTRVFLALKSQNSKTGPIPVSTTSANTCPDVCPLKGSGCGCYAGSGPLYFRWLEVTQGKRGTDNWADFCASVAALPAGQLWRHNQAGDLPGENNRIDANKLSALVDANKGKRGFTYTHKPLTPKNASAIANANAQGFTINLSANNLCHADELIASGAGPVVTLLSSSIHGNLKVATPVGNPVVICPATYRDDVTCKSCGLCQRADRKVIVGFPAHGASTKSANLIAEGV